MQKILFVSAWWPSRVSPYHGNFVEKHARIVAQSYNLTVVTIQDDPILRPGQYDLVREVQDGYQLMQLYFGRPAGTSGLRHTAARLLAYRRVLRIYHGEQGKPDLIHGHILLDGGVAAAIWAKLWRVPYVISAHATLYFRTGRLPVLRRRFARWAALRAAYLLPVSNALGVQMRQVHGIVGHYVTVGNVVDTELFRPLPEPQIVQQQQPYCFLHVSSFIDHHKNISGLVRAFSEVVRKHPAAVQLLIAGDGDKDFVQRKLAQHELTAPTVQLSGPHTEQEIAKLMQQANAFVLFSNMETQGVVLLEAQASGIPCIAPITGGATETMVEGLTGLLVAPADEQALIEAMLALMRGSHQFDGAKIRKRAVECFSETAVLAQLKEVYQKALRG